MLKSIFKVQLSKMLGDPTMFFVILIQPLLFSLLFGYLHQSTGRKADDLFTVFIGVGQMAMWQSLLYAGGIIVRHEFNRERTVFYSLLSRTNLFKIWAERLFMCIALSVPSFVISMLVGAIVFHTYPSVADLPYLLSGIPLYLFSLYCIGLPLILLLFLTVHGGKVIQTITYPIFLLSGMIVSVDYFPTAIQVIAYLFPITWSTHWIQDALNHNHVSWINYGNTITISLLYLLFSSFIYTYVMKKIRLKGEIQL